MKTEVCLYSRHATQELTLWLVGSIGDSADPPADMQPDDSLDVTLPTPLLTPNEIEHEVTNGTGSLEPQPPSLLECPSPSFPSRGEPTTLSHSRKAQPGDVGDIRADGNQDRVVVLEGDRGGGPARFCVELVVGSARFCVALVTGLAIFCFVLAISVYHLYRMWREVRHEDPFVEVWHESLFVGVRHGDPLVITPPPRTFKEYCRKEAEYDRELMKKLNMTLIFVGGTHCSGVHILT